MDAQCSGGRGNGIDAGAAGRRGLADTQLLSIASGQSRVRLRPVAVVLDFAARTEICVARSAGEILSSVDAKSPRHAGSRSSRARFRLAAGQHWLAHKFKHLRGDGEGVV